MLFFCECGMLICGSENTPPRNGEKMASLITFYDHPMDIFIMETVMCMLRFHLSLAIISMERGFILLSSLN